MKDETGRRIRAAAHKRTGRGVYWRDDRNCWVARIMVTRNGVEKNIFLGHFDNEKDALDARANAVENVLKNPAYFDAHF